MVASAGAPDMQPLRPSLGSEPRMTPLFVHLLPSPSAGPKHGYAMMGEVEERWMRRI